MFDWMNLAGSSFPHAAKAARQILPHGADL
jgi:hypothetical protein